MRTSLCRAECQINPKDCTKLRSLLFVTSLKVARFEINRISNRQRIRRARPLRGRRIRDAENDENAAFNCTHGITDSSTHEYACAFHVGPDERSCSCVEVLIRPGARACQTGSDAGCPPR